MTFRRFVCSLLALAMVLAPTSALATTPEFQDPELNKLWEALMRMRYDMSVRVDRYSVPEPMGGRFQFATEQDVVVDNFGSEVRVPLEDVEELWREESHKGRSLLIGSVIGIIAGAGITALVLNSETADGRSQSTGAAIFMGGVAGAALGIILGGEFGGGDHSWVREYP